MAHNFADLGRHARLFVQETAVVAIHVFEHGDAERLLRIGMIRLYCGPTPVTSIQLGASQCTRHLNRLALNSR